MWIIVPIRQYKEKYFYFFLSWVSADILTIPARLIFHSQTNFFYAPCAFLALLSLQSNNLLRKYWIIITIFFIAVCLLSLQKELWVITVSVIHLSILFFFLKEIIVTYTKNYQVMIFVLVLLFYELTVVAKYLNYFTGFTNNYHYFIITAIFEAIFGIFFIIFKADNRRLIFQFK